METKLTFKYDREADIMYINQCPHTLNVTVHRERVRMCQTGATGAVAR